MRMSGCVYVFVYYVVLEEEGVSNKGDRWTMFSAS